MGSQSLRAYFRLIRDNRNFRRLWIAQIVSEIGDWFYIIAIYSLLLQFTGKAQSIGLALVLQVLPSTLVGPTAGVVNDRIRRQRVMIAADLARMAIVLGMFLIRSAQTVWLIYPLLFFETVMWGFFEPARSAIIPNVVSEEQVLTANTVSSITWSFTFAMGSALGGLVAVLLGRDAVFVVNALSFLVSALLISRMRVHEPHAAGSAPFRVRELVNFSPVAEGVRYIRRDPRLSATVFLKAGIGIMGANWVIFPIMGERVFPVYLRGMDVARSGVLGMSLLMGARGIGALVGPLAASPWAAGLGSRMRAGIVAAFIGSALGYMALSRAPSLALACVAIAIAHCGGSVVWVFSTTLLQRYSDDTFRGRVFAADLGICMLTMAISGALASVAIDHGVGVRTVAFSTGLAMLFPAIAWFWALRFWRKRHEKTPT
ncbi:MAG: major facilitator superfamily 1 [Bryobacterales bacterium]|nr:major facilitator superfamily 1 [Bryobacterales bacterium]